MSGATYADDPFITTDMAGAVCWLTLNRAEQRNPLSSNMIRAISTAIEGAGNDPKVRVVVITGSGSVFSAGHDLGEMNGPIPKSMASREEHLGSILDVTSNSITIGSGVTLTKEGAFGSLDEIGLMTIHVQTSKNPRNGIVLI